MEKLEVWGTFSVLDHLRTGAFVAEVLTYDRLVIPAPPEGDGAEYGRWRRKGWDPDKHKTFRDLLGEADLLLEIPWDDSLKAWWQATQAAENVEGTRVGGSGRLALEGLRHDIHELQQCSKQDAPFYGTAGVIASCVGGELDHPIVKRAVAMAKTDTPIEAVVAYRSFDDACSQLDLTEKQARQSHGSDAAYHVFGWNFFVPTGVDPDDPALLRRAIKTASRQDLRELRQSFQGWVKSLSEASLDVEAGRFELEKRQKEMEAISRGDNTVARWAVRLAPLLVPIVGLVDAQIGAFAASAAGGMNLFVDKMFPVRTLPGRLRPVSYVVEAREALRPRWYRKE